MSRSSHPDTRGDSLSQSQAKDDDWLGYDVFIVAVSVIAIASLAYTTLLQPKATTIHVLETADLVVCVLFFADFIVSLVRAENRWTYLATWGWLDLISSIPALDATRWGRVARVIRLLRVLRGIRATKILATLVLRHRGHNTLLAASLVALLAIFAASLAVLHFETTGDSNIRTAEDAMWWAFTTVTTVGYGDHYPVTSEGRMVAATLMAVGVGVFGTIAGGLASWFSHPTESDRGQPSNADLQREIAALRRLVIEKLNTRDKSQDGDKFDATISSSPGSQH
jgi:voltage-gated potassium channel